MNQLPILSEAERETARAGHQLIAARLHEDPASVSLTVRTSAKHSVAVPLPYPIVVHLLDVLTLMSIGTELRVLPVDAELTTSQMAEILGCSRPTAVKLLSEHVIPFRFQGTRRRARLEDVLAYKESRDKAARLSSD